MLNKENKKNKQNNKEESKLFYEITKDIGFGKIGVAFVVILAPLFYACVELYQAESKNNHLDDAYEALLEDYQELRNNTGGGDIPYSTLTTMVDSVYNIQAIEKYMEAGETFAFVLGSETCVFCEEYRTNTLSSYNAEDVGVSLLEVDINYAFLFPEDFNQFIEKLELKFEGTPTTVFVKDGEIVEEVSGPMTLSELTSKLLELKESSIKK